MDWTQDPKFVASAFDGVLAGMSQVAVDEDAAGGRWVVWIDPDDPSRLAQLIEQPPAGYGGMVGLGTFSRTNDLGADVLEPDDLGLGIGTSPTRDRTRFHHTIAVTTDPAAARVTVFVGDDTEVDLTDVGLHPDQLNRLFAGSTTSVADTFVVTAYRGDGTELARRSLGG